MVNNMLLFEPQIERLPDHYPWCQDFIEAMQAGFWTAKKFTFDTDVVDFDLHMTDEEREMVKRCLAAIAQIEVAVKEFWKRLGDHFPHPSIKDLGITMAYIEVIHNNAYEKLLKKLGLINVFKENMDVPAIAGRVAYLNKHNSKPYDKDDKKQYLYSLILFTLFVENVSLFSQFYIILWLNRFDKRLKDAAQQVKYTRNEELLHGQAGSMLINVARKQYPELFDAEMEERILSESREAFKAECNLIDWMIGDLEKVGFDERDNERLLNAEVLKVFLADRFNQSLTAIGYKPQFETDEKLLEHTFWMTEGLYAPAKVDFFHSEPTEYSQEDTADDDNF